MDVRSYVTFIDDHEEDVVYFKVFDERHLLFATESGVYFYKKAPDTPGVCGLIPREFYAIGMDICDNPTALPDMYLVDECSIKTLVLDRRVKVKFTVPGYGEGVVLAMPDATRGEIAQAIMSEMGVEIDEIWKGETNYVTC